MQPACPELRQFRTRTCAASARRQPKISEVTKHEGRRRRNSLIHDKIDGRRNPLQGAGVSKKRRTPQKRVALPITEIEAKARDFAVRFFEQYRKIKNLLSPHTFVSPGTGQIVARRLMQGQLSSVDGRRALAKAAMEGDHDAIEILKEEIKQYETRSIKPPEELTYFKFWLYDHVGKAAAEKECAIPTGPDAQLCRRHDMLCSGRSLSSDDQLVRTCATPFVGLYHRRRRVVSFR